MSEVPHGEQIRTARKAIGWSLEKLASETGLSRSALSRIELLQQLATTDEADVIAKALGIVIVLGEVSEETDAASDVGTGNEDEVGHKAAANG